jgi:hypothetical protein
MAIALQMSWFAKLVATGAYNFATLNKELL